LTREIHSFGRVFSGCFYDTVRNIFAAMPNRTEASLLAAARTTGLLLIGGAKNAPVTTRFFQAVGRAMVLEDQAKNGGVNRQAITSAFERHNIALGSMAMLSPRASLAGMAPKFAAKAKGPILSAATTRDIKERVGAEPGARLTVEMLNIGGEKVAQATHHREVTLTGLDSRLQGVVAVANEPVLVGSEGSAAAIVSALPDASSTTDEVQAFVETLLEHNRIAFDGEPRRPAANRRASAGAVTKRGAAAAAVAATEEMLDLPTHTIVTRGGKKVLTRIRFLCRHGD
jgi:hypothetical protein